MAGLSGVPILILKEGTRQDKGREAITKNIMAARAVANAVRSTLGPKGMDKMMVDSLGDITVTNDGVTILKEMDVEHPAAKMIVEAAKAQDKEVGDGTTTTAVLAGEFLKKAEDLIGQGVHPTVIVSGYRMASQKALEILRSMAFEVSEKDRDLLEKISITAMTGKESESAEGKMAKFAVDIVLAAVQDQDGKKRVDLDDVTVEKKVGESVDDSEIIRGVLIDKERVHSTMPQRIEKAKIALLGVAIEMKDTETKAEITITKSDQFKLFMDHEKQIIKGIVDKVLATGANVVFCQKGIDDLAQHYLSKAGVMAFRRITKKDLKRLSKATGANIVTSLDVLTPEDLGKADLVEERHVGAGVLTAITGCKNSEVISLLMRGGTKQVLDGSERALDDAMHAVATAIEDRNLVAGGGAPEVEIALRLREYAATLKGREQLAVTKFAEAMEIIPKALAENAGFSSIDKLVSLKSSHERNKNAGLDAYTGEIVDMRKMGVVEPLKVKVQAITSASEAANMVLRIDDVITSKRSNMDKERAAKQMMAANMGSMGGMGGMGGMPGMGGMGGYPGMM